MQCIVFVIIDIIKVPIEPSPSAVSTNVTGYGNNYQMSLTLLQCQHSVIRWLFAVTIQTKSKPPPFQSGKVSEDSAHSRGSLSSETAGSLKEELTSPTLTDSAIDSSLRQLGNRCQAAEIVRSVLYATPDNVLTLYEILRQVSFKIILLIKLCQYNY